MRMPFQWVLATVLAALAVSISTAAVRAEEAFLCEGGRVVRVTLGQLEDMKRTDPCVAAYYGLTVRSPVAAPGSGVLAARADRSAPAVRPNPQAASQPNPGPGRTASAQTGSMVVTAATATAGDRQGAASSARAMRPNAVPTVTLQGSAPGLLTPQTHQPRRREARATMPAGPSPRVPERVVVPPAAHPETDFRNVRILNAGPGDDTVYRHLR